MGTQNCTQQNVCVAGRWGQGRSSQHLTSQLLTGQQGQTGPTCHGLGQPSQQFDWSNWTGGPHVID